MTPTEITNTEYELILSERGQKAHCEKCGKEFIKFKRTHYWCSSECNPNVSVGRTYEPNVLREMFSQLYTLTRPGGKG